jgi:hypothetical protein
MGLFNLFSKKSVQLPKPYKNDAFNKIYNLLFCDTIDLYKSGAPTTDYPWNILLSDRPDINELKKITADKSLEARQKMLACNLLAAKGSPVNRKELLGVIIEVALPQGLDTLAAFSEGTARYINHTENLIVWEKPTEASGILIANLFSDSTNVINQTGPWNQARKPFPAMGMCRMTFLVTDGLYFGEGRFEDLRRDPMGGPVIHSATLLMTYLTQHALQHQ